jgi:hypothetical protein
MNVEKFSSEKDALPLLAGTHLVLHLFLDIIQFRM